MSAEVIPTLVVRLVEQLYGVPVTAVREILKMPQVTRVPRRPQFIRGLINLRGSVIPVVDLRVLLGYPTLREELDSLRGTLDQRENDHKKWLAELEASVAEAREFRLTTNPHGCAFGKWYDKFMTSNMALALRMVMARFDQPHQALHGVGAKVVEAVQKGDVPGAMRLIEASRNTHFVALLHLFAEVRTLLQEWSDEVAIVVDSPQGPIATAADGVEGIDRIEYKSIKEAMHDEQLSMFVDGVGSVQGSDRLVTLLRMEGIFREGAAPQA